MLNGLFFAVIALGGLTYLINAVVPMEAGMAIVLWIGIVITAQAFQATPPAHAPAVAIGLFPAIAGWGLLVLTQTLGAAGAVSGDRDLAARVLASPAAFAQSGLQLDGLIALSQGFMVTCLVWSAMSAHLIDRQFRRAAAWAAIGPSPPSSASSTPERSPRPAVSTTSAAPPARAGRPVTSRVMCNHQLIRTTRA